ncbi:transposase [Pseudonocardia sp. KRD-184]|uniref:Transposase n=1 Tax=Pseudonocardia oceani TaxID=2792013 RepID=A0ABS6UAS3_9PSEU|nr:transposase [Pseudonocardia oceani]MBW0100076.1 transposase [Pseudonocardia oceani]MBW0110806.1 transposase [Pseudonocardia oceani]MBW0123797.1 transposase [Pseudonocardia oceani]MBW0129325.1 transposase [Pseudonocardia oceani]
MAHRHKPIPTGYDYLHVAIDDRTRVACIEALPGERDGTCAGSCTAPRPGSVRPGGPDPDRQRRGLPRRHNWHAVRVALGIRCRFTGPGCPWTNGEAERLNRTLLTEFAYARPRTSDTDRQAALDDWVRHRSTGRAHTALGGRPTISRLAA